MNRRELVKGSVLLGVLSSILPVRKLLAGSVMAQPAVAAAPLKPPATESIPVAFLISDGAVVIDFCGPWEVFQDAIVPGLTHDAFRLYTVAESAKPIRTSGGMQIVPDYTYANAPAPKVLVIPAQSGPTPATLEWIRKSTKTTDVTMSVCTGAFILAKTGLLSGKGATTHHSGFHQFELDFPDIRLKRGARFVEEGNIATAGGLTSGIDLAMHVVERYYGRDAAKNTAYQMEYQGQGWMDPNSNQVYAQMPVAAKGHTLCAVCEMEVDPASAPNSVYKTKTYYFCSEGHKKLFDATPDKYLHAAKKS